MRNRNIFMARKKQHGTRPTGSKLKIRRPAQQPQRPNKMDRHDQSLEDRDVGHAWWETTPRLWKFQIKRAKK